MWYLAMSTISQSHLSCLTIEERQARQNIRSMEEEGGEHVNSMKECGSLS
jgi:hypothetical protein